MSLPYGALNRRRTPQTNPIFGSNQVPNNAGGFVWSVDDWQRLDRFLIIGSDSNTYYQNARELTRENAKAVERCISADGFRTVNRIREISLEGRAPKQDAAIFALALAASVGNDLTRAHALYVMPEVCRTGTALLHFVAYCDGLRGWGRGLRSAVERWYNSKSPSDLEYQLIKYKGRDGWSHRDLMRLAHPIPGSAAHGSLFGYAINGGLVPSVEGTLFVQANAAEALKQCGLTLDAAVRLIRDHKLPRECVPTELLTEADIWEALLEDMPLTAMIRNLATMTRVGLLDSWDNNAVQRVVDRLADGERLRHSRVHPISVLSALKTYAQGHGERGRHTWNPVQKIVDSLDAAFYEAFTNVEPSGKRQLIAVDISGSMSAGYIAGLPGVTPRYAAAAMAMVFQKTEPKCAIFGFCTTFSPLDLSHERRLDDVASYMSRLAMGGTDCSLPMVEALRHKAHVDTFVVLTDNETWAGDIHPMQALRDYRNAMESPAKLAVAAFTSTGFSIADPNDAGSLDIVGFDSAAPQILTDFAKAEVRSYKKKAHDI